MTQFTNVAVDSQAIENDVVDLGLPSELVGVTPMKECVSGVADAIGVVYQVDIVLFFCFLFVSLKDFVSRICLICYPF